MKIALFIILAALGFPALANDALHNAIVAVESGGCKDPSTAIGDSGKALGWAQMHFECWQDCQTWAKAKGSPVPSYRVCARDLKLSKQCITLYAEKYKAKTPKEVALVWHYGPSGRQGKANWHDPHGYWAKVQAKMK